MNKENKIRIGDCAEVVNFPNHYSVKHSGRIVDERMSVIGEKEYLVDTLIYRIWFLESELRIY